MKRKITIRFSESGKSNPKEWESSSSIEGTGADEDEAEKDAIHKFKAAQGDVPYTVDRNAKIKAANKGAEFYKVAPKEINVSRYKVISSMSRGTQLTARLRLIATAECLEADSAADLQEKILKHAQQMDRTPRGSKEYHALQFKMQRMLKELRRVDPLWEDSSFDPLVWSHSGKPPRQSPGLLRADLDDELLLDSPVSTEDPLSTGVVFDTLIDGEPSDDTPTVQVVTRDDGSVQEAPEQNLLNDDLVVPSIKFG